jgi:hypothetical protein
MMPPGTPVGPVGPVHTFTASQRVKVIRKAPWCGHNLTNLTGTVKELPAPGRLPYYRVELPGHDQPVWLLASDLAPTDRP